MGFPSGFTSGFNGFLLRLPLVELMFHPQKILHTGDTDSLACVRIVAPVPKKHRKLTCKTGKTGNTGKTGKTGNTGNTGKTGKTVGVGVLTNERPGN